MNEALQNFCLLMPELMAAAAAVAAELVFSFQPLKFGARICP
jgi:hypothetical protein